MGEAGTKQVMITLGRKYSFVSSMKENKQGSTRENNRKSEGRGETDFGRFLGKIVFKLKYS